MSDILDDYREWLGNQSDRVRTHYHRCHISHDECMVARLADEITRLRDEVERLRAAATKPIAWQVTDAYGPIGAAQWMDGETRWPKNQSVPLYLTPPPLLTEAEREAIKSAMADYEANDMDAGCWHAAVTLRALLARHGGGI